MSECLKATVELECGVITLGEVSLTVSVEDANDSSYAGFYSGYHDPADLGAVSPTSAWGIDIQRIISYPATNNFYFRFGSTQLDLPSSIMVRFPTLEYSGWYVIENDDDIHQLVLPAEVSAYFQANIGSDISMKLNSTG